MHSKLILAAAVLAAFCLSTSGLGAQVTINPVVSDGDTVAGVGNVTSIFTLAVNNSGAWLVEADTDNADTNTDSVLLNAGGLLLREGQSLALPVGAMLDSFDAIVLNNNGDSAWNFFLDGTTGSSDDSGIYFNATLVIQESDVSTAAGFSAGTPYIGFFETKFNDNNQCMVMASVDDPAIATSVDRAIVVLQLDGSGGLVSETVLAKEGDILPGQVDPVADFGTGPHNMAFNNSGSVLVFVDTTAVSTLDGCIYLNSTLLAQEGSPSPVGGRNYDFLSSRPLDLNNSGDYVFRASLDGDTATDEVIVKNGAVFVQEGDSPPAIAPFSFTSFGTGPVAIDDNGNVLWFGDWDDPDTTRDTGLFLNDQLIVQEGVTQTAGGTLIEFLSGVQDGFAMSDNGEWIVFEGRLSGGIDAAFLVQVSPGFVMADPSPGLAGQVNAFTVSNGTPLERVIYAYALNTGSRIVPGCPGLDSGMANPVVMGARNADAGGGATLNFFVPNAALNRTVLFRAVQRPTCHLTNLVSYTFQ